MSFFLVDPIRKYAIASQNGQICTLAPAFKSLTVGNDRIVIAAIAGKRFRLMGWQAVSQTATVGSFNLHSASGSAALIVASAPAIGSGNNDRLPIVDSGYLETNTGEGLYSDCFTGDIFLTVFYISYVP